MQMYQVIKQNILDFFYMYAREGIRIAAYVFFPALLIGGLREKLKRGASFFHLRAWLFAVLASALGMYVYIVIGITMLSRTEEYSARMNLRLFSTFSSSFTDRMYLYENILLFVPLGFLLFLLAKPFRHTWLSLLIGMLASLSIETAQLVTHLGRFELDDILTNTAGMLIGHLACKIPAAFYHLIAPDESRDSMH